jgi:hypothetical protein
MSTTEQARHAGKRHGRQAHITGCRWLVEHYESRVERHALEAGVQRPNVINANGVRP